MRDRRVDAKFRPKVPDPRFNLMQNCTRRQKTIF